MSRTALSVKFKEDRNVRLENGRPTAADAKDTAAIREVLQRHPGLSIRRLAPRSAKAVSTEREQLEKRTGRQLPDLNSWYHIEAASGIEPLLEALNALPAVEIAQADPQLAAPAEPLQGEQAYRQAAGAGVAADYANAQPGGKGDGVTVTDLEASAQVRAAASEHAIAAGDHHSLMVDTSTDPEKGGVVWAWGRNTWGQLGRGHTADRDVPVQVRGLPRIKAVGAGAGHSVALAADGTVWAWGRNSQGQIGDGSVTDRARPVQIKEAGGQTLTGIAGIAVGPFHTLAVKSDGTLYAWGYNAHGQLGTNDVGNRPSPYAFTALGKVDTARGGIAAGYRHSVARMADGRVLAWGDNEFGQLGNGGTGDSLTPVAVKDLNGPAQLSSRGFHTLALREGQVFAWGYNRYGQIGDGSRINRNVPVPVSGPATVTQVAAGQYYSLAKSSLTATPFWAWGSNADGQFGDGTLTSPDKPKSIPIRTPLIAAGLSHSLGVTFGSALQVWGDNAYGQLGNATTVDSPAPDELGMTPKKWNLCHEEFTGRQAPGGAPVLLPDDQFDERCDYVERGHGIAMSGIIGASDSNGAGLAGIAPNARLQLTPASVPDSIALATAHSKPGDVLLYEVGVVTPQQGTAGPWYPWEFHASVYDQTRLAVAKGVTVVEAAGNGSNSLDSGGEPDPDGDGVLCEEDDPGDRYACVVMSRPNSGAIIVGAGEPPAPAGSTCNGAAPARSPWPKSTYGSRLDVQAYGHCAATPSYPGVQNLTPGQTDPNKMYHGDMGGTSSASAITAGAVAALQGVALKTGDGSPLSPEDVRTYLRATGTKQPEPSATERPIGPQPDLKRAIELLRVVRSS
ncbi:S8 family serine peptidase [Streptomyces sp. A7024]|uniref:S8 family serine peptidase n=1 Tax=Streptomyces coryli TaxID=1128680 RepID=A0A6G4U1M3_9ACTN|nr:S8 family serine peptidase [Streptomyces coryli]NGN65983.1 S8 family serine peptidase [Streptomyces coryli]